MLLIVFLGSVLIVGIFGMQSIPYEQTVYIEEIVPSGIATSTGENPELQYDSARGNWYVVLEKFVPEMRVMLSWNLYPTDCTNKNVKVVILGDPDTLPCDPLPDDSSEWRGEIVFHRAQAIHLQYRAQDSATGAVMDLYIFFI